MTKIPNIMSNKTTNKRLDKSPLKSSGNLLRLTFNRDIM